MTPTTAAGAPSVTVRKIGRIGYSSSLAASCRKLTPESTFTLCVRNGLLPVAVTRRSCQVQMCTVAFIVGRALTQRCPDKQIRDPGRTIRSEG